MNKKANKLFNKIDILGLISAFSGFVFLVLIFDNVFAQAVPPGMPGGPSPPAAPIPWGNPLIYGAACLLCGVWRLLKQKK